MCDRHRPALSQAMSIYKIIQNTPLEPQDLQRLVTAYKQTLPRRILASRYLLDGPSLARHVLAMGQIDRLTCPKCGVKLIATRSPSTNGLRALRCPDCDCLDPLKSEWAMGWLKSELQPPKR